MKNLPSMTSLIRLGTGWMESRPVDLTSFPKTVSGAMGESTRAAGPDLEGKLYCPGECLGL